MHTCPDYVSVNSVLETLHIIIVETKCHKILLQVTRIQVPISYTLTTSVLNFSLGKLWFLVKKRG